MLVLSAIFFFLFCPKAFFVSLHRQHHGNVSFYFRSGGEKIATSTSIYLHYLELNEKKHAKSDNQVPEKKFFFCSVHPQSHDRLQKTDGTIQLTIHFPKNSLSLTQRTVHSIVLWTRDRWAGLCSSILFGYFVSFFILLLCIYNFKPATSEQIVKLPHIHNQPKKKERRKLFLEILCRLPNHYISTIDNSFVFHFLHFFNRIHIPL